MGFLQKLLGSRDPLPRSASPRSFTGTETLEVVGEASYQAALEAIVGTKPSEHVRVPVQAVLVPEPQNPYDQNAIRVDIAGQTVGYLTRDDAVRYRPGLLRLIESNGPHVALAGQVVGGGRDDRGRQRMLGVFLDHDPAILGVRPPPAHHGTGFRTGFANAWTSDESDDSYDLSWFDSLSENDTTAIRELRERLTTATSAIERHYLMCELEKRLYRCRDVSSALTEYDTVCRAHDAEMDAIAVELRAKLGSLPLFETYRQAAIRHQKAKDWNAVVWWAERGIAVYGSNAGVAGAVEDLEKRRAHARAKITATPGRPTTPSVAAPARVDASVVVEVLVCAICGSNFDRDEPVDVSPRRAPTAARPDRRARVSPNVTAACSRSVTRIRSVATFYMPSS